MGTNKAFLNKSDSQSFIQHIIKEFSIFHDILLSVGTSDDFDCLKAKCIKDISENQGPLVGIYSCLSQCKTQWAFVVSCDLPLLSKNHIEEILNQAELEYDAIVPISSDGKIQPLFALYKKSIMKHIEHQLENNNLKLKNLLPYLKVKFYRPNEDSFLLSNINTQTEYLNYIRTNK